MIKKPQVVLLVMKLINFGYILEWKSKWLSDESIKCPSDPHNFLNPWLNHLGTKTRVLFTGNCSSKIKLNTITRK